MPPPRDLDLLTLKVVFESRVTWATSAPILVFLGLSVLDLGLMYATDRQTSDRRKTASLFNCLFAWCLTAFSTQKGYIKPEQ